MIDGGWHAPPASTSSWWDTIGDWEPDATRFPHGLAKVADAIAEAGLTPGIWIEIESVGSESRMRSEHPHLLMQRDGRLVEDNGRFFLDLGNEDARRHARAVFERLWSGGYRYFKIDFNVECSVGCDRGGSVGQGLVEHVRCLYALFDDLSLTHPEMVIENCASGGNRLDHGLLRHTDLCSISDHGFWDGAFHTYPALSAAVSYSGTPASSAAHSVRIACSWVTPVSKESGITPIPIGPTSRPTIRLVGLA